MNREIRVLLAEDSAADAEIVAKELVKGGLAYTSKLVKSKDEFFKALQEFAPDIVLCDYNMPGFSAPEALEIIKKSCPETPLIVVSGTIGEDVAVDTIKLGANDYLMKDRLGRLVPAVRRAIKEASAASECKRMENELARSNEENFKNIFDHAADGILLAEAASKKFHIGNPAICGMLGYTQEEIRNLGVMDICPEKDLPYVIEQFEKMTKGEVLGASDIDLINHYNLNWKKITD